MIYVPIQRYKVINETLSTDGNNDDDDSNENTMKMEKIFKKDALEMTKLCTALFTCLLFTFYSLVGPHSRQRSSPV